MRVVTISCDICGAPAQSGNGPLRPTTIAAIDPAREKLMLEVSHSVILQNSDNDRADLCVRCRADLLRQAAEIILIESRQTKESA